MPLMDEFREEREAIKKGTPKEKLNYFMDYYKWHVIVTVAIIVSVISLGYQIISRKDTAFCAALINGIELTSVEEYIQSFAEYAGIDLEEYDVLLDTTMRIDLNNLDQITISSSEKLMAFIAAKNLDVLITDAQIMEQHANNDTFMDLRNFLSEEQYARYESNFYYIDQAVVDEKNAHYSNLDQNYVPVYPDPRNPDAMRDPIPVGIYLDDTSNLRNYYYYDEGDVIVGIVGNMERSENTSLFLDFILQ